MTKERKVVIVGDGAVGSSIAFTLMQSHSASEIVIIDVNKDKAEGDVLDMVDGMSFVSVPKVIRAGDYSDCLDAKLVIITAGASQKPGETRLDLLHKNAGIMNSICDQLKSNLNPEGLVMVVSNPVDVLSYLVYRKLSLPSSRVFGSGTVLDTSRLKTAISEDTHIDPRNIHTFIVGEHGDSEVAAWSATSVGGLSLTDYCAKCGKCGAHNMAKLDELHEKVKNAAYEIIAKKGATFYAVALAVNRIVTAILNDENSVLTVSTLLLNEFDGQVSDVYMSLPCVVNSRGIEKILRPNYSETELKALVASGTALKEKIKELGL
jgi:L-lactate dehydrogenase